MFDNLFAKYSRAISDDRERKSIKKLYVTRNIMLIVFILLFVTLGIFANLLNERTQSGDRVAYFATILIFLLWLSSLVAFLVVHFVFVSVMRDVFIRPRVQGEMPEVAEYREKVNSEKKLQSRNVRTGILFDVAGIAVMFIAIIIDIATHPNMQNFSYISIIGGVIGLCLIITGIVIISVRATVRSAEGKSYEMQTETVAQAIDKAQGRKHKYSLRADKNSVNFFYILPNPELRERAESVRAQYLKRYGVSTVISVILALVLAAVLFSGVIFDGNLTGFIIPELIAVMFIGALIAAYPYNKTIMQLKKQQLAELQGRPDLAVYLKVLNMNIDFARVKGKTMLIAYLVAFAVSLAIAIAIPDEPWSFFATLIVIFGLILQNKFVTDFRKSMLPYEAEIDRLNAEKQAAENISGSASAHSEDGDSAAESASHQSEQTSDLKAGNFEDNPECKLKDACKCKTADKSADESEGGHI